MATDPYRYFRPEAKEILEGITQGALEIEKGRATPEILRELLRLAHTLKGAAGVVKLTGIAGRAHAMEEILASHREGSEPVPREDIDRVLRLVDEIGTDLAALNPASEQRPVVRDEPAASHSFETVRVEVKDLNLIVDRVIEVGVQIEALRLVTEEFATVRDRLHGLVQAVEAGTGQAYSKHGAPSHPERAWRTARELGGVVSKIQQRLRSHLHRVERDLAEVRKRADGFRLLPASSLFAEMERGVREVAKSQGKTVVFETTGGDQRLDAHVLSNLRVALLHLVRNAVVHGIESQESRVTAGKAPRGQVSLVVERRGHHVSFQCMDDGRGVDLEAVRRAALKLNLLSEQKAKKLDMDQALRLIFRPGLTTTKEADLVSGRGVGLDIVLDTATKLKGQVEARSEPGRGTVVEVLVPVSLTSLEMLIIEQAGTRLSLPFSSVVQVLRISRTEIGRSVQAESIVFRGQAIPFCDLAVLVGAVHEAKSRSSSVVVVQANAGVVALGVDRLLGRRHEVVRPIPAMAGELPLFGGASFDPEGNPSLVLDPRGVVQAVHRGASRSMESRQEARLPVLVVDDSLTTRMLEQTILEANGYEVDLASSAEEALQVARKRRYGVMLVDVEMPGMNGFEFLDCVRSDPELRQVPAILMTTRGSGDDRRRGMEAGARAYLLKSEFDEGLLLRTIRGIIG